MKRLTNTNLELKARGVGNLLVGLIGDLSITAVIVRGAANIVAGARTKMSTIFHEIVSGAEHCRNIFLVESDPIRFLIGYFARCGYKLANISLIKRWRGKDTSIPYLFSDYYSRKPE